MFRLSEMVFILRLPEFVQEKGAEVFLKQTTFFSKKPLNTEFSSPQTYSTQSFLCCLNVGLQEHLKGLF